VYLPYVDLTKGQPGRGVLPGGPHRCSSGQFESELKGIITLYLVRYITMVNQTISHYKIINKLGEGGMGIVYKAQDTKLKRDVALKFLPPQALGSGQEKTRLVHEAQAAAALSHPNICTIHEIDEAEGQTFIAMECVEGPSLKEKLESGPLKLDEAIDVTLQVAQGLQEAHRKGVIHRDIKPSNIMLTAEGQVKIMDFGLAKSAGHSKITKSHTTLGTVAYMSPEQARGEEADHRTDIWSLGVALYEMLTGKLPFRGAYEQAVVYAILNREPEPVTGLRAEVPMALEQVVLRMLEKDRDLRSQSAEETMKALTDVRAAMALAANREKDKAIAVLPFENISPDKDTDYFADGLAEELIVNLSGLKDMRVVPRTASMRYKGTRKDIKTIGGELGTRYVMAGSVRRFKDNLRISVQLIDVLSNAQLWAETYKGQLADVFDIQEQVSKQIVDALMLRLTPTEKVVLTKRPTANPQAFDLYLRARDFLYQGSKSKHKIAIQLFEKAIELDPRYAAAYAGLGESYAAFYERYEKNEDWLERSIESSLKGIMYDPTLSEAYAALSLSYLNKDSLPEALEAGKKAIELDPNSFIGYWILGRIYHGTDRYREAVDCYEKVIPLNPDFYTAYGDLAMSYEQLGEKDKYNDILQAALQVYPRYLLTHPDDARAHMYYAIDLAQAGRTEEAKAEAAKALEMDPADPLMLYNAACFYSRTGERRLAVESLKGAAAAGFRYFEWVKRDPDLESIRNDPGYIELMKGK
jgi:TolB-like protein/Tfp pilus assembly protein PilF/predicted Ser/Thr protein kinase